MLITVAFYTASNGGGADVVRVVVRVVVSSPSGRYRLVCNWSGQV